MTEPSQKTILVVDDDQDFLLQLELILTNAGYRTIRAESRGEAEELLARTRPDAVVADLMLEEDDAGFMLCYRAKKLYPDLPVIIVTGVAGETGIEFAAITREERSWIKADLLLDKPVRPEQILGELEKLMGTVSSKQ